MEPVSTAALLPFSEVHFVGTLVIAAVLGAVLGLERSIAGKHAGMRTYALVAMGSCLFVTVGILASLQFSFFASVTPLALASSVIIGVGFIGSGLAVFRGEHPVELTTATGIWLAAAIGVACAFELYLLGLAATVMGLIIFTLFLKLENMLRDRYGTSSD
ncbi:MAG TPA: MgtC/SapB family protein [Candidatus Paceibacterota bacterium]|nr:MgtC/SapB family protein [Candidatus Paceibacterota bacterium]